MSEIVARVDSLPVFSNENMELKNICFIIKSCCHVLFSTVHFNVIILTLVGPNNVITTKMHALIGCVNLTFGWSPKILQFDVLIGKCQWRAQSLEHLKEKNTYLQQLSGDTLGRFTVLMIVKSKKNCNLLIDWGHFDFKKHICYIKNEK